MNKDNYDEDAHVYNGDGEACRRCERLFMKHLGGDDYCNECHEDIEGKQEDKSLFE